MECKTTVLGLMSGSSLDGLDACLASFEKSRNIWKYEILECQTIELPSSLLNRLERSHFLSDSMLQELDNEYGEWIAVAIDKLAAKSDLIGIHGHTVFHSPAEGRSVQIGNAQVIADFLNTPVVSNFRNLDISLGGQGAPLVPMGEKLIFPNYDGFLNLGGICNASFKKPDDKWVAGDIGPFNQVFNFYASKLGHSFDKDGLLAKSSNIVPDLINQWDEIAYFKTDFPKSLGNDWVRCHFLETSNSPEDVLASFAHFISGEVSQMINRAGIKQIMVTGGGAYNQFLIERIQDQTDIPIVLPSQELIDFKEALIFGFLGLLRIRNETNVMAECTGASQDSCSGDIYPSSQY